MLSGAVMDQPWVGETYAPPLSVGLAYVEQRFIDTLKDFARDADGSAEPGVLAAAAVLRQVAIDHFPSQPKDYRLTHAVGQILVTFKGAEARPGSNQGPGPMTIDEVTQDRTIEWSFATVVRDLGWAYGGQPSGTSPGAYGLMDALRVALVGYQLPGFTKLVWWHDRFTRHDPAEGVWYYESLYSHRTRIVERDRTPTFPTWQRSAFLERAGLTTVPVSAVPYTFDGTGAIQLPFGNVSTIVLGDPDAPAVLGTDYTVDSVNGLILLTPDGAFSPGDTVNVAFSYAEIATAIAPSLGGGAAPTAPTN